MAKFQGSGFSFQSLNQNIKVVVFHTIFSKIEGSGFSFQFLISKFQGSGFSFQFLKNYHNLTIFRVILNFAQECYYLKNHYTCIIGTATYSDTICIWLPNLFWVHDLQLYNLKGSSLVFRSFCSSPKVEGDSRRHSCQSWQHSLNKMSSIWRASPANIMEKGWEKSRESS